MVIKQFTYLNDYDTTLKICANVPGRDICTSLCFLAPTGGSLSLSDTTRSQLECNCDLLFSICESGAIKRGTHGVSAESPLVLLLSSHQLPT